MTSDESTDNHEYNTPAKGTNDWGRLLNENFASIDRGVEIRDVDGNRGDYEPKDGAKYLAIDTKTVYLGDGSEWREFATFGTDDATGNEVFASEYEGATLDERIDAALADLPDGQGRIRVGPNPDGAVWQWSEWTVDPTAYSGVHLDVDRNVRIEYQGDGVAITVDPAGDLKSQDSFGHRFTLEGGIWENTGNTTGWFRGIDVNRAVVRPAHVSGLINDAGDCFGIQLRNEAYWSEDVIVDGKYVDVDVGVDLVPASMTGGGGTDSFHDCRFFGTFTGVQGYGFRWEGEPFDVVCGATVILAGEEATAHYLNGNFQDAVFRGSDSESVNPTESQTSFELGPDYYHGPLLLNHTDHRGVDSDSAIAALFGIEVQGQELRLKNLNRPDTTFTMYRDGTVDFTPNE
ncbi:hypothetical protein [Halapricum desulfuricans]|uniref:Right-handed parallel beta-helix repeat-containing protein n=1 Tax=Halapricum desulfuricans TaxID=2841257 RepID=A0A897N252_9EURY|nr:hypothetical protein [Halapricum desulfuricans]QSG07032.1 Uncharacterized protein HSR121_2712 [Halapricum desulfuricans]